jgi:hypothetical protein
MKKSIYILVLLIGTFSCSSYKDSYHAEHQDNHDLKQSKRIIEENKAHKAKNDKIARENQERIQAELNEKNKTTSKTKVQKATDTSFKFY